MMLKVGRHIRLSETVKIIVGRNEGENRFLEMWRGQRWILTTPEHPGPTTLVDGAPNDAELVEVARFAARYCDGKHAAEVRVLARQGESSRELLVAPRNEYEIAEQLL